MSHFTYLGGSMVATTTINGHVSRAIDFQARTDIYLGVGRQTPWNQAKLIGTVPGDPFTITSDTTFGVEIDQDIYGDPVFTVNITLTQPTMTLASLVNTINNEWQVGLGQSGTIASQVTISGNNYLQITSPSLGDGTMVRVSDGNPHIGFEAGKVQYGYTQNPPPADPSSINVEEIAGFKRVDVQSLVVPDADAAAELIGTVPASPINKEFDTTSDRFLGLLIDTVGFFQVTLTNGVDVPISQILTDINAAYHSESGTTTDIAFEHLDGPYSYIKLVSPTVGLNSLIQIDSASGSFGGGSASLGFTDGTIVNGHVGGSIVYRDTQWREIVPSTAISEGARWVYLEANLKYDQFPLPLEFREVGWYSHLIPNPAHAGQEVLLPSEVDDFGILEIIDTRKTITRAIDEYEKISIIIEF